MGTLLTFEPPAPRLRAALRGAAGADVGARAAARAIRAEIVHYRAHLHLGGDAAGLAELRRTAAAAMRPELPEPAASLADDALVAALLEALRFRAYPEVPRTLEALRRRRPGAGARGSGRSRRGSRAQPPARRRPRPSRRAARPAAAARAART